MLKILTSACLVLAATSSLNAGQLASTPSALVLLAQAEMKMPSDAPAIPTSAAVRVGDIEVTKGFVKATMPGQPVAGAFVTLINHGKTDDRLIEVKDVANISRVELHQMSMEGDVMRMRKLPDGIALPAGQTVALTPGGLHMMLMGVRRPYAPGGEVAMTLVFEKAGSVKITVPVADMKGMGGGHQHN